MVVYIRDSCKAYGLLIDKNGAMMGEQFYVSKYNGSIGG